MRYTLVQDESCHWYLIPADKKKEFYAWFETEDYENGIEPDWANHFGSGPEQVTFENPEIE